MPTAIRAQTRQHRDAPAVPSRPSLLSLPGNFDPWVKPCCGECVVLYIHAQPVAVLQALNFDVVSLNHRLFEMRRHGPRRWLTVEAVQPATWKFAK